MKKEEPRYDSLGDLWMATLNRWSYEDAFHESQLGDMEAWRADPWSRLLEEYETLGMPNGGRIRRLTWHDPAALLRTFGHPDDIAVARGVLEMNGGPNAKQIQTLAEKEKLCRWVLDDLERIGFRWVRQDVGEGYLEAIGGHPAHGEGRGRVPSFRSIVVWSLCYVQESVNRNRLSEPTPPWVKYRISNSAEFRSGLVRFLNLAHRDEPFTDEEIRVAINSWLKRKGTPPPWISAAE